MNKLMEANEIPKWLASSLLVVEAILAYAKDKPNSDAEAFHCQSFPQQQRTYHPPPQYLCKLVILAFA